MPDARPAGRTVRIDLPIEDEDDVRVLRGALLAARATERAEMERRGFRHSYGKASASAQAGMGAEVEHHRRRIDVLDRLVEALARETP